MEQSGKPYFALKYANHLTARDKTGEAIEVLQKSVDNHPESVESLLALHHAYRQSGRSDEAKLLLQTALSKDCFTQRISVWMALVTQLRESGFKEEALEWADKSMEVFRSSDSEAEAALVRASLLEDLGRTEDARVAFEAGLERPAARKSRAFWLAYVDFELRQNNVTRARTLLQKAKVKLLSDADAQQIWYASIVLELNQKNMKIAQSLMFQASRKF